jgi:hypothetical protein
MKKVDYIVSLQHDASIFQKPTTINLIRGNLSISLAELVDLN